MAATTFILLTTTGCSKDEICEKPITEVIETVKDNTCFDEVVVQQGFDLSSVNRLEEYTKLAKELHKIDFRRIEIDEETYNNTNKFSTDEIRNLIDSYNEENKGFFNTKNDEISILEQNLSLAEDYVNLQVYNGYGTMWHAIMLGTKSKILDANGLSAKSFDKITINPSNDGNINDPEQADGLFTIVTCGDIREKVTYNGAKELYFNTLNLYTTQDNLAKGCTFENKIKYNKERIDFIDDSIEDLKVSVTVNAKVVEDKFLFWSNGEKIETSRSR